MLGGYSYCLNNPLKYSDPTGFVYYYDPWTQQDGKYHPIKEQMDERFGLMSGDFEMSQSDQRSYLSQLEQDQPKVTEKYQYVKDSEGNIYIVDKDNLKYLPAGFEAYSGIATSVAKELYYSKTFGTWMGKNLKLYNFNINGNLSTGGKYNFGKAQSDAFKWVGRVFSAISFFKTYESYKNGEIGAGRYIADQTITIAGAFENISTAAVSVGWTGGQIVTGTSLYQTMKFNYWYKKWENILGPPNKRNEHLWIEFYNTPY